MQVYLVHIPAMELATYMKITNTTDAGLAVKVRRDRSTVTRWRLKRTRPDWEAIQALEEVTEGAVTFRDFMVLKQTEAAQ